MSERKPTRARRGRRCASCGWRGLATALRRKRFGDGQSCKVCPTCKSEDVFDDDPEAWVAAEEEHLARRSLMRGHDFE